MTGDRQLETIGLLHDLCVGEGIEYWLFGGWAVDFHAGRITRRHADIDIAVWRADLARIGELLAQHDWSRSSRFEQDGYTEFRKGSVHLDVAFLERDEGGTVFTPLEEGRGDWPVGTFGHEERALWGVRARVVGLASLIADKSEARADPSTATKDRADIAVLVDIERDD